MYIYIYIYTYVYVYIHKSMCTPVELPVYLSVHEHIRCNVQQSKMRRSVLLRQDTQCKVDAEYATKVDSQH